MEQHCFANQQISFCPKAVSFSWWQIPEKLTIENRSTRSIGSCRFEKKRETPFGISRLIVLILCLCGLKASQICSSQLTIGKSLSLFQPVYHLPEAGKCGMNNCRPCRANGIRRVSRRPNCRRRPHPAVCNRC